MVRMGKDKQLLFSHGKSKVVQQLEEIMMVSVSLISGGLDYPVRRLAAHSFLSFQPG